MASEKRGNLTVENVPQPDEDVLARMRAYQNTRNCGFRGFMPDDGGILIGTRFADSIQVHSVKFPLGARKQLTFLREPVKACVPAPSGCPSKGFIYGCDKGGDEKIQYYFFDIATGSSTCITDGKSTNRSAMWSEDGSQIVYTSNERNDDHFDVYCIDFAALINRPVQDAPRPAPKRLMTNDTPGYYVNHYFDGSMLLVEHYVSVTNSSLHLVDTRSAEHEGDRVKIAPQGSEEAAVDCGRVWLEGGKPVGVIFASNQGTDFKTVRYYEIASKKTTDLVSEAEVPWDVEDIEVSAQGVVVISYNADGCSTLYTLFSSEGGAPGGKGWELSKLELGLTGVLGVMHFNASRSTSKDNKDSKDSNDKCELGFGFVCANAPLDAYTLEFHAGVPQALTRWTEAEVGGLNASEFVTPDLVRFKSFDDREISAFVYRPARTDAKVPVIIHPHGGPEGQHRPSFSPLIQFLTAQLQVAVIDPNVRGSDGYGKPRATATERGGGAGKVFVSLDNGEKREDSVKDIGALLDWVATQPGFDTERIAVWGGSYGGYMVGISNFVTFLTNTAGYRRQLRRAKYGDESDPAMREWMISVSPLTNAHKIKAPLFIVQGANDPRVPLSEAEQMRDKVRANGSEVWYMVASDEGHGFAKKSNADQYQLAMVAFFQKFLLAKA